MILSIYFQNFVAQPLSS